MQKFTGNIVGDSNFQEIDPRLELKKLEGEGFKKVRSVSALYEPKLGLYVDELSKKGDECRIVVDDTNAKVFHILVRSRDFVQKDKSFIPVKDRSIYGK